MMQSRSKPWAAAGGAAVAVPAAGYAALLLVDALRCSPNHAMFMAFFAAFAALPLAALGLGVAALAVGLWRGEFPLRGWRIGCCVLALGAVTAAAAFGLHDLHDPSFCRIDM